MSEQTITAVPCRYCDTPTPMLGTKLCDRCWELDRRIRVNPELAFKILCKVTGVYFAPAVPYPTYPKSLPDSEL